MIHKNELRYGNYFHCNEAGYMAKPGIQKVESIGYNGVNAWQDMGAMGILTYEQIEPIPLTAEILEKAGLVKWKTVNSRYAAIKNWPELLHGYVIYELQDDKMLIATNGVDFKYILLEYESNHGMGDLYHYIDIQYVHQMQNGYQFLTGEELQISM